MRIRAAVRHFSTQQYIMPRTWPLYVYVYDLLCSQAKYIVGQKQLFLGVAQENAWSNINHKGDLIGRNTKQVWLSGG